MIVNKYKVFYTNGKKADIRSFGFTEAVILAMNYAVSQKWSYEIEKIQREDGVTISKIVPPTFKF